MIGFLRGRLAAKHPPMLVMDVGGVGYELEAPMATFYELPAVGEEITLLTHLLVREDAQVLYGFGTEAERALFRSLLRISGIGAKMNAFFKVLQGWVGWGGLLQLFKGALGLLQFARQS